MKNTLRFLTLWLAAVLLIGCVGGTLATEESKGKKLPEWGYSAIMYELNTRQFTEEGTFAAAQQHLPRLKDLGVDIIWFMPISPIGELERKGELGSYYAISDYKAINPEFGTMDDFNNFVDAAHAMGIKVIIDWVANHTSPDAVWSHNEEWYRRNPDGTFEIKYDWTDIAQLDFDVEEVRVAMIDAMSFWLRETDMDGFRCDVAWGIPTDFWNRAIDSLTAINPDIFMLAEAEVPEHHDKAFDSYYTWELHHLMNEVAQDKLTADKLWDYYVRHDKLFPKHAIALNFTSNHDENSWNGTEFERMGDGAKTFAVMTYVVPGMPLIYNGQEVGLDRRLEFFVKDEIEWVDRDGFTPLYKTLGKLRKENPVLWSAEKGADLIRLENNTPEQIFSMVRHQGDNTVIAVLNLSADAVETSVETGRHAGEYTEIFSENKVTLEGSQTLSLAPWEYRVYTK